MEGKKALLDPHESPRFIVVDATEPPLEKPKKREKHYSGKNKQHALKTQLVVDLITRKVIDVAHGRGACHDFDVWKQSGIHLVNRLFCYAHRGYQGLQKLHKQTALPFKKNQSTSDFKAKKYNRRLAQIRIRVEHVIRCLKVFRVLSERYRGRHKGLARRWHLLAGLYNFRLGSKV